MACSSMEVSFFSEEHIAYIFRLVFLLGVLFDPEGRGDIFFELCVEFQWTLGRYKSEDTSFF
jgi:hypothetical protein